MARRQPPNLLRHLSLSIHRDQKPTEPSRKFKKCSDKRCEFCKIVIDEDSYTTKNGFKLTRNHAMTCKTRDLIYMIICEGCLEEYIGETGNQINLRTNVHRNQIENENYAQLKVSKHIHTCGNNKFKVFPFQKSFKQCHVYREELEEKYRKLVQPTLH